MVNIIKRLIDLGTHRQSDPVYKKHIRFANSVALFVCLFIIQNAILSVYYQQNIVLAIQLMHLVAIALVPFFNSQGKRVLASAWFSSAAIFFVTIYAIIFTLYSYNFIFLSMIIFLQFFLFSRSEKRYIIIFTTITTICFAAATLYEELHMPPLLSISAGLLKAQRMNSITGIPVLSLLFGLYAFSAINKAEQEAATEKEKTEQLLLNILPQAVADRFKNDRSLLAEEYQSVSVLFADIVGFTKFSEKITPDELVRFLNDVFSKFDGCAEEFGLEKIKTIGDAYMVAGGVPIPTYDHTLKICCMALKMQEIIKDIKSPDGQPVHMRMGISTGPVTAGVIGVKKFIYDLWGDTVNTASRMESHAEESTIQVTAEVYERVKDYLDCKTRGIIHIKGKGEMLTYFLEGVKAAEPGNVAIQ